MSHSPSYSLIANWATRYNTWQRWELYFTARCERLEILYSDTNLDVKAEFHRPTNKSPGDSTDATLLNNANADGPNDTKPQAICERDTPNANT